MESKLTARRPYNDYTQMMTSFQPVSVAYGFIRCIPRNMQIATSANRIHLKNKAIGIAAATLLNTYRGVKKGLVTNTLPAKSVYGKTIGRTAHKPLDKPLL